MALRCPFPQVSQLGQSLGPRSWGTPASVEALLLLISWIATLMSLFSPQHPRLSLSKPEETRSERSAPPCPALHPPRPVSVSSRTGTFLCCRSPLANPPRLSRHDTSSHRPSPKQDRPTGNKPGVLYVYTVVRRGGREAEASGSPSMDYDATAWAAMLQQPPTMVHTALRRLDDGSQ